MAKNANEAVLSALDHLVANGLPDIDEETHIQKNLGKGFELEDIKANLKVARCICALHETIFGADDEIKIAYGKSVAKEVPEGEAGMLELSMNYKGFKLALPDSARHLETYGKMAVEMAGLEKEYPSNYLNVGILMFSCHLMRQYCQAKRSVRIFSRKDYVFLQFFNEPLARCVKRIDAVFDHLLGSEEEPPKAKPYQFDGRVIQMVMIQDYAWGFMTPPQVMLLLEPPKWSKYVRPIIKLIYG